MITGKPRSRGIATKFAMKAGAACAAMGLVVTALTVGTARPASAEYIGPYGMGFSNINIAIVNGNSYWNAALDRSASNWNASGAGTSIARVSSSAGRLYPGRYADYYYGQYAPYGTKCVNRGFDIRINAQYIEQRTSQNNWDIYNISTITHEVGHALQLADLADYSVPTLMDGNRDRTRIYVPQAKDVKEVKDYRARYGC